MRRIVVGAIVVGVLLLAGEAFPMGKLCLFSEVKGVVLSGGKPVPGAVIERDFHWHWKDERGHDEAKTDAKGEFRLPAIFRSSLFGSILPHEPVVEQTILIKHGGETYKAWSFAKGEYKENGELGGRTINLRCSLESQPRRANGVFGICEMQ